MRSASMGVRGLSSEVSERSTQSYPLAINRLANSAKKSIAAPEPQYSGSSKTVLTEALRIGFFEYHTRYLTIKKAENLITKLANGTLTNEEVFNDGGHGCLVVDKSKEMPFLSVTGPKRGLMSVSKFNPYFATPYGDMMLTGCFGLVRAFSQKTGHLIL